MIKLGVLAAELNLWANETEQIYRATKDIKYRRNAVHLRYLAATLNQSGLPSTPTLDQVTTAGNTTVNTINVGGITSDYYQLDTAATPTPVQGMMFWDSDRSTVDVQLDADVSAKIGQDNFWYVKNQSGATIPKGKAVMAVGTLGASGRILIDEMVANGSISSKFLLGITAEDIANGADGFVMNIGKLRQVNTAIWPDGTVLYCDPTTPGNLTSTKPSSPNLALPVAFVVHSAANGVLAIRVSILDENALNTPTLAQVTTAGNTTTNAITVGGLTISNGSASITKTTAGATLTLTPNASDNAIVINNNGFIKFTSGIDSFIRGSSTTFSVLDAGYVSRVQFHWGGSASWINTGGNLLINTTTDAGYKLDVNGTARVSGALTIANPANTIGLIMSGYYTAGAIQVTNGNPRGFITTINGNADAGYLAASNVANFQGAGYQINFFRAGNAINITNPISSSEVVGFHFNPTISGQGVSSIYAFRSSLAGAANRWNLYMQGTALNYIEGNVLINTTTDSGFKLDVVGADSRFNGVRVGLGAGGVSTNTVVGSGALITNTTGSNNTAVGYEALFANTTGNQNTAIGANALRSNTGGANTAIGYYALLNNSTGGSNVAIGSQSLQLNTTGAANIAIGQYAALNTNANGNIAIGNQAIYSNTAGTDNVGIGNSALRTNVTGINNVAIGGGGVLFNNTASNNTAVGYQAGFSNTSGVQNSYFGYQAGIYSTGGSNSFFGFQAGQGNTSGSSNVAMGNNTMQSNGAGIQNVAIGVSALQVNTSNGNTALGFQAGVANTTGANNIFIGYQATGVSATESNRTWIGNSSTTSTWVGGNLLVGTTTNAGYKLDVIGTARFSGQIAGSNGLSITGGNIISQTGANSGRMTMLNLRNTGGGFQSAVGTSLAIAFTNREVSGVWTDDVIENIVHSNTPGAVTTGYNFYTHNNQLHNASPVLAMSINGLNVGIGTSTPTDKLHIVDNTNGNKFGRISAGGTDASAAWVAQNDQVDNIVYRVFGSAVTGTQFGQALARSASLMVNLGGTGKFLIGSYSSTDLIFGTSDQARMRLVDSTGNFLIGTMTDTGNKLTVSGTIDSQGYKINNIAGYTGILNIVGNPPGQQNLDIQGGIIVNVF